MKKCKFHFVFLHCSRSYHATSELTHIHEKWSAVNYTKRVEFPSRQSATQFSLHSLIMSHTHTYVHIVHTSNFTQKLDLMYIPRYHGVISCMNAKKRNKRKLFWKILFPLNTVALVKFIIVTWKSVLNTSYLGFWCITHWNLSC